MADCGSSGTVLDRVARTAVLLSSGNNGTRTTSNGFEATKQLLSNLLGHAAVASQQPQQQQSMMGNNGTNMMMLPLHAPEEIVLEQPIQYPELGRQRYQQNVQQKMTIEQQRENHIGNSIIPHHATYISSQHYHHQQLQQPFQQYPMLDTRFNAAYVHQNPQYKQSIVMMNQQMMIQQQSLMATLEQQQRNLMLEQEKYRQHHETKLKQEVENVNVPQKLEDVVLDATDTGHEGHVQTASIEELSQAWYDSLHFDDKVDFATPTIMEGHEGIVNNVDMKELSKAWAQANAEFQSILDEQQQQQLHSNNHDEYYEDMNNMWAPGVDEDELASYDFVNKFADKGTDVTSTYTNNGTADTIPKINYMEEGMNHFNAGNIKEAIQSFEYEIQVNNPDSASAWRMLGKCHAENDMDREAIICLEHAIDRDPYCSDALLALGVSYVNELNTTKALRSLRTWITNHPKFAGIEVGIDVYGNNDNDTNSNQDGSQFDEVQQLLLQALEELTNSAPGDGSIVDNATVDAKADVLEALGVVYNVSRDYEAAIDSFRQAVALRPLDYQLWNKLGATLANSNQSHMALPAYQQAIQIKPRYARAWLNMAISHSNLQNYDEAVRCYLQTLSLNPNAVHCWSYINIALRCAEKWDLIPYASSQDITEFHNHYDFI